MSSKEEITAFIHAKGEEIRSMKENKASKEDITARVNELLQLKNTYKEITGEDWVVPGQDNNSKSKKNDEKESKAETGQNQRKLEKEARKLARESQKESKQVIIDTTKYGDLPLIQSSEMTDKIWTRIQNINPEIAGTNVLVRAHVTTSRNVGKGVFLTLRQSFYTVQAIMFQNEEITKDMVKFANQIPKESVVDIYATVTIPENLVISCSQSGVELLIKTIHVVTRSQDLPFQIEDAARPDHLVENKELNLPSVGQDMRLDFRWIDTRTPANQAIFRISSAVGQLFREFLTNRGFIEIHTPKLLGGASEGGAQVFRLNYFDRPAVLAQSPQLYKQICCACAGFEKVFEVGPVFRAENSQTHRHMCEFTGLDFEMVFHEHYYEVLDIMSDLFIYIFDNLNSRFRNEIEAVRAQHYFEDLQYLKPSLRITFDEGIQLLRDAGYEASFDEDLSTELEKALGRIVKEKYGTDFYMMDKYPLSVRPFYTMPAPENPRLSNSYDLFIRGEEIVSGAQRVHDPVLLQQRAEACGIPVSTIQWYVDAFKHGALPHGGGGVGLERVVMLFLGLKNIRKASLFPRDPKRLTP